MNNFKFYAFTRFKLGISASETYKELCVAHSEDAPGRFTIFLWYDKFRSDTEAGAEAGAEAGSKAGRPRTTRTAEMISIVQELVQEDCQMSTRFLADCLEIGKSTVQ